MAEEGEKSEAERDGKDVQTGLGEAIAGTHIIHFTSRLTFVMIIKVLSVYLLGRSRVFLPDRYLCIL